MKVLALDIGDKRIGIAYGNTKTLISSPISVLPNIEVLQMAKPFKNILNDYYPEKLIFGLPKSLDGQDSDQTNHIVELAKQIAENCQLPYDFVDERLSSKEAKSILRASGMSEKQMRGKIDSVAASLFLETWLKAEFSG